MKFILSPLVFATIISGTITSLFVYICALFGAIPFDERDTIGLAEVVVFGGMFLFGFVTMFLMRKIDP